MHRAFQYAEGVLDGSILSCTYVQQACQRFMDDLKRDDIWINPERCERVITFIQDLKHGAGRHAGKPFILEPWQAFITVNVYGWERKATGKRRFRTTYIEMARKQGKSALMDAYGLYHLSYDNEPAAEILLAANSREQAQEIYKIAKGFVRRLDPEESIFRPFRYEIHFQDGESFFKVMASDDKTLDSYNPSCGIVDEYHSAPDSKVRDTIRSGQGMRDEPMLHTITTPGYDKDLPCYELRTSCTEILAGTKKDDSLFTIIYGMDSDQEWKDPQMWTKSNPNLGVTVHQDWLAEQVQQAINNPSDEVGIRTKNMSEWMDSAETWIPDRYILEATQKVPQSWMKDRELFLGVDLASNQDMTAVAICFEREEKKVFVVKYYLPAESLKTRPDKELYKQWVREKKLTITPGNVTDYEYITRDILELDQVGYIVQVAYDTYNATDWAIRATNEGLPLVPFSQAIGNFNKPTKALERLLMKGEAILDDSPVTRYCYRNVVLRMDVNGNVKPDKQKEKKKIDGVTASCQSLAMYQEYANTYVGKIF